MGLKILYDLYGKVIFYNLTLKLYTILITKRLNRLKTQIIYLCETIFS